MTRTPPQAAGADPAAGAAATSVVEGLRALPDVQVRGPVPLAELTTLRIGGAPRQVVRCGSPEAVAATVGALDDAGVPVLILGGGSNLVVAAGPLDLVVVETGDESVHLPSGRDEPVVRAGAGLEWDALVAATVDAGLGGLECLSGIPGSVGATPVQNVGAYGVEVASLLHRVRLYDRRDRSHRWVDPAELGLAYRTSVLKNTDRAVVTEVEFTVRRDGTSEPIRYAELARTLGVEAGERVPPARAREAVLGLRRGKGMVLDAADHDTWSAGSFFTNPVVDPAAVAGVRERAVALVGAEAAERMPAFDAPGGVKLSAGWLIERAGFGRGFPGDDAPARLSTKHTLALTNRGAATADDVVALARRVRDGVREAFGVDLHPEPVWVGCSI